MDSTSTKIGIYKKTSQEAIDNFKLSKSLVNLLMKEPFYSRIIRSLNKVETQRIPTAGVLHKDGEITLWWNREFLASLSGKERIGLLKHECLHLVYGHTGERRKEPHLIWNYSTDLAINSIIPKEELPKGGLIPGESLPSLSQEEMSNMTNDSINNYLYISKVISSLPKNKTSEYYFKILNDNEKFKESCNSLNCSSPLGFDSHDGWDELSDEEKEMIKAKIEEITKEAIQEANSNGWGSIPMVHQKYLNKRFSRKIKWQEILKRFCGFTRKNERISSNKRLSRKYPFIQPGVKKDNKPTITIYIDESGSVDDASLSKFYDELNSLSKVTDFYIYKFDANVHEESKIFWRKGKRIKLNRTLVGGTCFKSVTKHALKNKKIMDGYIIFTDGYAAKPPPSVGLKRAWIINHKNKTEFEFDKNDIVINMSN